MPCHDSAKEVLPHFIADILAGYMDKGVVEGDAKPSEQDIIFLRFCEHFRCYSSGLSNRRRLFPAVTESHFSFSERKENHQMSL